MAPFYSFLYKIIFFFTVYGIALHVNKARGCLFWLLSKHCREIIIPQSPSLSGQSVEVLVIFNTMGGMESPTGQTLCLLVQKPISLPSLFPSCVLFQMVQRRQMDLFRWQGTLRDGGDELDRETEESLYGPVGPWGAPEPHSPIASAEQHL